MRKRMWWCFRTFRSSLARNRLLLFNKAKKRKKTSFTCPLSVCHKPNNNPQMPTATPVSLNSFCGKGWTPLLGSFYQGRHRVSHSDIDITERAVCCKHFIFMLRSIRCTLFRLSIQKMEAVYACILTPIPDPLLNVCIFAEKLLHSLVFDFSRYIFYAVDATGCVLLCHLHIIFLLLPHYYCQY